MPNITFSLDKDLLREVNVIAARYDTSLFDRAFIPE